MKRMKPNTLKSYDPVDKFRYFNELTGKERRRWWTKARVPGTVRPSRMPGGSSYRGDKPWVNNGNSLSMFYIDI